MLRGLGRTVYSHSQRPQRFFSYLSFDLCEPEELPRTLHARTKPRKSSYVKLAALRAIGRLPIVVCGRVPTIRNNPRNIHATVSTKSIMREHAKGALQSRVYNIKVPGKKAMYATVGHFHLEGSRNEPMSVTFTEFVPGRRTKINMPVNITNEDLCPAIRKGADFRYGPNRIPMYWRGDHHIPKAITLDLEGAVPDLEFRIAQDANVLPEGLQLRYPSQIYTLASLRSTRKYDGLAEELDAEATAEAAQAEADAAAKKAAKGAAKVADAKAGEAAKADAKGAAGATAAKKK